MLLLFLLIATDFPFVFFFCMFRISVNPLHRYMYICVVFITLPCVYIIVLLVIMLLIVKLRHIQAFWVSCCYLEF